MTARLRWATVLWLAVNLTAAPQAESGTDPDPDAEVGGTVISAKTGEPLRGARITLQPNGGGRRRQDRKQATTDLNGQFLLRRLAAGQYTLQAEKTGYETRRGTRIGRIKLAQGESKTKLVIPLRPAVVITGRVLDSFGEPLADARVGAFRRNFQPGSQAWGIVQITTTDDLGEYRLYGLAMGKYIVGVSPRQEPAQDGAFILDQVPAFYPGVASPEEAAVLKVSWGSEVDAIDLKLAPAPATVVSGILAAGDTGEPLEGYLRLATKSGAQLGNFSSTKDGRFVLYGIPEADLTISSVSRNRRQMLIAEASVRPSASHVEEVELLVQSGRPVSGRIVLEDPPGDAEDEASESRQGSRSINVMLVRRTGGSFRRPLRTQAPFEGGAFEIKDVQPGEYHLRAFGPSGSYLRTLARSGKPLDGFIITVPTDSEITDLELRFAFDGGVIAGSVGEGAFGTDGLAADARLIIIPDAPETSTAPTSAQGDDDGSFEITGLSPGGYTFFAVENRSSLDLWDPDVRRAFRASGRHVSLSPKETATVELSVIKEPDEPL